MNRKAGLSAVVHPTGLRRAFALGTQRPASGVTPEPPRTGHGESNGGSRGGFFDLSMVEQIGAALFSKVFQADGRAAAPRPALPFLRWRVLRDPSQECVRGIQLAGVSFHRVGNERVVL